MSPRAVENVTPSLPFDGGVERTTQVVGSDNCLDRDTPTQTHIVATELNSAKWRNLFTSPMQTFADADEFKKALYKYSVANKFEYAFKRNSSSRMSVYCKVNGCEWKLMANAVGKTLRVTKFNDEHDHSAQDHLKVTNSTTASLTHHL